MLVTVLHHEAAKSKQTLELGQMLSDVQGRALSGGFRH
jgi:hypothetical protein